MTTLYTFNVQLPNLPEGSDVVRRQLSYMQNGVETVSVEVAPDTLVHEGLICTHGDTIRLTLVDIDEADNASDPRMLELVVDRDMVPPTQPGELGLVFTREEVIEDETPTEGGSEGETPT